ncbi:MAG: thermonuclease family protein [Actinomycetes bacterium]
MSRVVDGDTVVVDKGRRSLTLRLIGIDTPETVAPATPVMCFGPQASQFAERTLAGEPVLLEFDRSQGRLDRYGRTLAYVWTRGVGGSSMFNERAVRAGYAVEYTYDAAYAWQQELQRAERAARASGRGLWAQDTCNGNIERPAHVSGHSVTSGTSGTSVRTCAKGYRPCLPVRVDLDCADVTGPVRVTGRDQYHLDANGDGVACATS